MIEKKSIKAVRDLVAISMNAFTDRLKGLQTTIRKDKALLALVRLTGQWQEEAVVHAKKMEDCVNHSELKTRQALALQLLKCGDQVLNTVSGCLDGNRTVETLLRKTE